MTYIELLDKDHKGMVMKLNGREQFLYETGKGWIRSGLFLHYSYPEADSYELYREISEERANELIKMQEEQEI
ncbi:MAG: hypothetical protein Q4A29_09145 [Eubacteriales bacterium]|nr:hypothetical protein [Eubacteriales bacterium]